MKMTSSHSLALEGSAWYRCMTCRAVFKLKILMVRHLKSRHSIIDRPEWELDNNDERCAKWWERVKVEGTTVTRIEPQPKPPPPPTPIVLPSLNSNASALTTPTFSLRQELVATTTTTPSNSGTSGFAEELKKFKCDLCEVDMWFAFKKSLYAHLLKNHDRGVCKEQGVSMCRFCGFKAESPSHLRTHIRRHTGESEDDISVVECDANCGKVFSTKASMRKHMRFKCGEAKRLCLDDPVQDGEDLKNLRIPKTNPHVFRQSANDLPFKCPKCVETFPTQARLEGHLGVHSGDQYRCRYCSGPFAHLHTRGAHETNAHNEELGIGYRCPICSKNFANIATIRGHYKYTHWLDLPAREEIEKWKLKGNVVVMHEEQLGPASPSHTQNPTLTLVSHPPLSHSHSQQQQQSHIMYTSTQPTQTLHVNQSPSYPHSSSKMSVNNVGLRMGVGVSQITMGALIGHVPTGGRQFPPRTENKKVKRAVRGNTTSIEDAIMKPAIIPKPSPSRSKKKPPMVKIERKKFHCRKANCEEKFQRRWELTWHLEKDHGEFTCEFCSLPPFATKMEMVHHQYQIHHRELGSYECRVCGRGLESPRGVQEHVAVEHPGKEVPLTLEAKMWRKGSIPRKRVQRPTTTAPTNPRHQK